MPTSRVTATSLALAFGLAFAGCRATPSPQDQMRATVSSFLQACGEHEPRYVLAELVPAAQDTFIQSGEILRGCSAILRIAPPANAALTRTDFRRASSRVVAYSGGDGRVQVRIAGRAEVVELSLSRAGWRIEGPA